jgi:hypothetical protein
MNRTGRIILPQDGSTITLLTMQDTSQKWRVVELFSFRGLPWEGRLSWTLADSPPGPELRVSVPHAVRLCVYAQTLGLKGLNRSTVTNQVGAVVVDGCLPTTNQLDVVLDCDGQNAARVDVPPFASRMELMLSERAALAMTTVVMVSGLLDRVTTYAAAIPSSGMPMGGTHYIEVLTPMPMTVRMTFFLTV